MKPSQALRIYLQIVFVLGLLFIFCLVPSVISKEIEPNALFVLPVCWNMLFMLMLPLVLDWSEHKYFHVRFLQIEELSYRNPELKAYLDKQCQKLAVQNIRLAVIDSNIQETVSYGLWKCNPRLIVPNIVFTPEAMTNHVTRSATLAKLIPSIELELSRLARQELTIIFTIFAVLQIIVGQIVLKLS